MYLDFYHLKQVPFHITPDPAFLFLSPSHQKALASITYGVAERQGFVLITGEVGVGKTTILRAYLDQVNPLQLKTIFIPNAHVAFPELLTTMYRAFGLEPTSENLFEMITQFHQLLLEEYRQGRNIAIIIDEAQLMPLATLEQLRLLSNLEVATEKLVQIVLVGQPELEQQLQQYALRQVAQRIVIRTTIVPLTEAESFAYIHNRLAKVALPGRPVFTRGALKRIVREAHGVPRLLNILCTQALVTGFGVRQHPITARLARAVIADFTGAQPSPRWHLALAASAGLIILVAGGLWLSLRGHLLRTAVPGSTQTFSQASTQAPLRSQEPLPVRPNLQQQPIVSADVPPHRPVEPPTPPPSGGPSSVPHSPQAGDVDREAESSPSTGEANHPSAAQLPGETQPDNVAVATETQGLPPQMGETTPVRLPRTVIIKRGDSVWKLAMVTYGFVDEQLLKRIKMQNPHLKNLEGLPIGDKLVLPVLEAPPTPARAVDLTKGPLARIPHPGQTIQR
jgi:general secretion pathway protein A